MALHVPTIKNMFVPDEGYVLFDVDLAGADAQVVAWEADDDDLKTAFRAGLDVHSKNAEDMLGRAFTQADGTAKSGAKGKIRQQYKQGVHATNYGASPRTVAITLGWTIIEAERFQSRWFSIHPGIKDWQRRTDQDLMLNRRVSNAYGYRIIFYERPDGLLPEALAWIPQSTIALLCFKGALAIDAAFPEVEVLLQVHDSIVFQIPRSECARLLPQIKQSLRIAVPYPDPLYIQWGPEASDRSWGECGDLTKLGLAWE